MEQIKREKQSNVCKKYGITREQLKTAADSICARGVAKSVFQNTNAVIACLDLLTAGDVDLSGSEAES